MGLGSTGLDAQPHAGAISCQIEPQEMGTDGHCTVRLRTWGRNISPPATSLPPYSSPKHETNCAQQRGKSNRKSGATHQPSDTTCSLAVGPKGPHFLDTLRVCQGKYSQSQSSHPKLSMHLAALTAITKATKGHALTQSVSYPDDLSTSPLPFYNPSLLRQQRFQQNKNDFTKDPSTTSSSLTPTTSLFFFSHFFLLLLKKKMKVPIIKKHARCGGSANTRCHQRGSVPWGRWSSVSR